MQETEELSNCAVLLVYFTQYPTKFLSERTYLPDRARASSQASDASRPIHASTP